MNVPEKTRRFPRRGGFTLLELEVADGQPRVICLGSDGAEGGEGEAADVVMPSAS
jgi:hypothetical protein